MRQVQSVIPILLAVCVASAVLPKMADASTLMGDVISGSYNYPCSTCTDTGNFWYSTNPFVVTDLVESTLNVGSNQIFYSSWSVDFGPDTLLLTMVPAPFPNVFYSVNPFNGPVFTVLSGYGFSSVTDVITNLHCTPCNPVTAFVSEESLFVNWQGAGGQVGDTVQINFTVSENVVTAAVPEPSTWAMLLIGFAGIGFFTAFSFHQRE